MIYLYLLLLSSCLFINLSSSSHPKTQSDIPKIFQQKTDTMITAATNQVGFTTNCQTLNHPFIPEGSIIMKAMQEISINHRKEVYGDIKETKKTYGKKWNFLPMTVNKIIDHKRIRNVVTYFKLLGMEITNKSKSYKPGDVIVWEFGNEQWHIGLLSHQNIQNGKTSLGIHILCCGIKVESIVNSYPIIAHFRLSEN